MFNNFRPPHLPQTHVDGSVFLSDELSPGENVTIPKVVRSRKKIVHGQQNQILKSRPKLQKNCPWATKSNFKKSLDFAKSCPRATKPSFKNSSDVAINCPRATKSNFKKSSDVAKKCPLAIKPNFKSCPMSQEIVHGQQNQILKSRPMSQKTAPMELSTCNKTKF